MQASVVEVPGLSCSAACGIFLDQGLNSSPLRWQMDSYPLRYQGSPTLSLKIHLCAYLVETWDGRIDGEERNETSSWLLTQMKCKGGLSQCFTNLRPLWLSW